LFSNEYLNESSELFKYMLFVDIFEDTHKIGMNVVKYGFKNKLNKLHNVYY